VNGNQVKTDFLVKTNSVKIIIGHNQL
jgi:hypothetical protein